MDSKKLGIAAASLLGAATMLAASPAHADEVAIDGPIICDCGSSGPFLKIEANFSKLLIKWDEGSTQFHKIEGAFLKIQDAFFKIG